MNREKVFPLGFPILFVKFGLCLTSFLLHFLPPFLRFVHPLYCWQLCVSASEHCALNIRRRRHTGNTLPHSMISISASLQRLLIPVWRNDSIFQNTVKQLNYIIKQNIGVHFTQAIENTGWLPKISCQGSAYQDNQAEELDSKPLVQVAILICCGHNEA